MTATSFKMRLRRYPVTYELQTTFSNLMDEWKKDFSYKNYWNWVNSMKKCLNPRIVLKNKQLNLMYKSFLTSLVSPSSWCASSSIDMFSVEPSYDLIEEFVSISSLSLEHSVIERKGSLFLKVSHFRDFSTITSVMNRLLLYLEYSFANRLVFVNQLIKCSYLADHPPLVWVVHLQHKRRSQRTLCSRTR